ncbi:hypothetical protein NLX62_00355 [Mycobacteriaceae bacterium Msp059]|nr:hypothetical protein [Mycobacteriaceae bacterium Msp059]
MFVHAARRLHDAGSDRLEAAHNGLHLRAQPTTPPNRTDLRPMIDHCTDPNHTTTRIAEGDYERCGDCGRRLREGDPRNGPDPIGPAVSPPADIYDATSPPGVTQLPAVTTGMTPAQFREWLAADGTLYMVILPANRTFVIKVPGAHHEFFVAMMQQVRFALGPEVQAVRMNMVTGPGADVDAATGKADDAPQWAQPAPPEKHEYIARPTAEQEQPDGLTTRCPHGGICPSDCSRTPDGCQNVERCAHGVRMGIGRYCADCDTSPVKYGPGAAK